MYPNGAKQGLKSVWGARPSRNHNWNEHHSDTPRAKKASQSVAKCHGVTALGPRSEPSCFHCTQE